MPKKVGRKNLAEKSQPKKAAKRVAKKCGKKEGKKVSRCCLETGLKPVLLKIKLIIFFIQIHVQSQNREPY